MILGGKSKEVLFLNQLRAMEATTPPPQAIALGPIDRHHVQSSAGSNPFDQVLGHHQQHEQKEQQPHEALPLDEKEGEVALVSTTAVVAPAAVASSNSNTQDATNTATQERRSSSEYIGRRFFNSAKFRCSGSEPLADRAIERWILGEVS